MPWSVADAYRLHTVCVKILLLLHAQHHFRHVQRLCHRLYAQRSKHLCYLHASVVACTMAVL